MSARSDDEVEPTRGKRGTSTSGFGVSKRESHDASDFYARFTDPILSDDETVNRQPVLDQIFCVDARRMDDNAQRIRPNSVALVVTSPPYFAGKEYETALGEGHVPGSYKQYLKMLHDVFAKCAEKLEDGGRIAVNVANLGRKPYRSLSADIIRILEDDLGLLLRGEILWRKQEGSSGNCAWGSFQKASNPVLRDLTERVVVASKGRFDRALSPKIREKAGLPFENTISKDDYMRWTMDVWDIPPESAKGVGHPAPFPAELPQRLIELYTYRNDVVLDPFMGSGSTAVAAINTHRHYLGFDTDPDYAAAARVRASQTLAERMRREQSKDSHRQWWFVAPPSTEADGEVDFQSRAVREGRMAKKYAKELIDRAGFVEILEKRKVAAGVEVNFVAKDCHGYTWYFDVSGAFSKGNDRAGLRRTDTLWKALGKASAMHETSARDEDGNRPYRLVLLTTDLPPKSSAGHKALQGVLGPDKPVFDAIPMMTPEGQERLAAYAQDGAYPAPT